MYIVDMRLDEAGRAVYALTREGCYGILDFFNLYQFHDSPYYDRVWILDVPALSSPERGDGLPHNPIDEKQRYLEICQSVLRQIVVFLGAGFACTVGDSSVLCDR